MKRSSLQLQLKFGKGELMNVILVIYLYNLSFEMILSVLSLYVGLQLK